ncbi:hypothetical protein G6F31_017279 [Rhizopus arrhizus]|nr:hypothetical protein G6F31_017279 [Rhizopus arrhizus]
MWTPAEQAAHQQAIQRQRADRARRHRHQAAAVQLLGFDADVLELQLVVANHQRGRAQVAHPAFVLQLQPERARGAQQRDDARPQRHKPAAAEALLVGFAVFQQGGVQAQAGVHQEQPAIEVSHLHRLQMALQEAAQGDFGVLGDAVAASEVIERALGQDAEGHALAQHGAGHGVKCAVAAGGDDHALLVLRALDGGLRRFGPARRRAPIRC